jgi:hypothetical protein
LTEQLHPFDTGDHRKKKGRANLATACAKRAEFVDALARCPPLRKADVARRSFEDI